jgi:hypothetical protein
MSTSTWWSKSHAEIETTEICKKRIVHFYNRLKKSFLIEVTLIGNKYNRRKFFHLFNFSLFVVVFQNISQMHILGDPKYAEQLNGAKIINTFYGPYHDTHIKFNHDFNYHGDEFISIWQVIIA